MGENREINLELKFIQTSLNVVVLRPSNEDCLIWEGESSEFFSISSTIQSIKDTNVGPLVWTLIWN